MSSSGATSCPTSWQLGHKDPRVTLGIYAHVMLRSEPERAKLRRLIGSPENAAKRSEAAPEGEAEAAVAEWSKDESPADAGGSGDGRYWARTSDLQLVELALSQLS
jgi:hypothetical protein